MNHPGTINRRVFTCKECGYSAQVYGEMYFDYGCNNYIATFFCKQCCILHESIISKMEMVNIEQGVTYNLGDEPICLKCGEKNSAVWNKETGRCPKCSGKMDNSIDGQIKVRHSE